MSKLEKEIAEMNGLMVCLFVLCPTPVEASESAEDSDSGSSSLSSEEEGEIRESSWQFFERRGWDEPFIFSYLIKSFLHN